MSALPALEVNRQARAAAEGRPHFIVACWRARSLRATVDRPMTVRRALALNEVLAQCELPVIPGALLQGVGGFCRFAAEDVVSADEVRADQEYLAALGSRNFTTHFDHHAPAYDLLLSLGFGGLRRQAMSALARYADPQRRDFLASVLLALEGAAAHMRRWAEALADAAARASAWRELLLEQAERFARLAEEPPRSFVDALQLVYAYHTMAQMDDRYAMAFGRLDQYLWPFYQSDLAAGRINAEMALAFLEHFFARITWNDDVQNIAIGGVKPEDGADATNELSLLILEACRRIGRPGGNITARIHRGAPQAFLRKCVEVIRSGIGYPALFNDEVEIPALLEQGYPLPEARDYCFVGCIEVFIPGRMAPWADSRFNLLRCVNLALFNGEDSLTGEIAGLRTGEPPDWEAFYAAFLAQMKEELRKHIEGLNRVKAEVEARAADFTSPLLSALVQDCIERGRDMNDGGARYPANHGVAAMGIGVTADSLMAIKRFVYDERRFTLDELRRMLRANFAGHEAFRMRLLREAPKYGNDEEDVDAIACRVTRDVGAEVLRYRTPQGGRYWALMAANVQNIPAGREVGASADGRLAQQPLSDAASPTFGRDRRGPTAVVRSVAKLPYHLCPGGNVINMKFHPSVLAGDAGLEALVSLIRTCFALGGVQLQFNTVDREVLRRAMDNPRDYEDLVVRVSGFSAHFTKLDRAVQEDVLARTEHGA